MSSGYRNDDRDRGRRRPSPPRSSRRSGGDERNASSSSSRHETRGGVPPPPPPLASRRVNEGGRSTLAAPPKFSGNAFTETELLKDIPKKKFTGRCRLFLGNLPLDLKESELKELFTPHGEISELYLSGKGFAFLRLDTRAHAESAKEALDGKLVKNRQIRVRYAVHGSTIKLKELSPVVSNEMLHLTFSAFGEVERAVHIVDEKGKPTGEGIIEFEKKSAAQEALNQIRERVFLLTANSRPLQAELLEPKDEEDGFSEKMIMRTQQLIKERELGPRFATMNSFEYIYGRRWKELFEFENKRRQELEAELREQRRRLDADMEVAYEDYKAELLREELLRRQEELERLDAARLMRDQQRHHMMEGGMDRWADGPMSRPPPPFGMQRPPPMGGMPSPFGMGMGGPQQMGGGGGHLGMGRELMDGNGRGGDRDGGGDRMRQQNGHGPSPLDVNKLLQSLNKPNDGGGPGRGGGGGDERGMGLGGGLSGTPMMQHLMHGGMHGGMGNPLDRPPQNPLDLSGGPSPLAAFANMINPLNQMRRPDSGPGPGGSSLPPGSGNRIPPPPPPIGGMKPPPNQLMDFPPEKRSRH